MCCNNRWSNNSYRRHSCGCRCGNNWDNNNWDNNCTNNSSGCGCSNPFTICCRCNYCQTVLNTDSNFDF